MKIKITVEVDLTNSMKELNSIIQDRIKDSKKTKFEGLPNLSKHDVKGLRDLYRHEAQQLKQIKGFVSKENFSEARKLAYRMDTATRELIPQRIWELINNENITLTIHKNLL